MQYEQRYNKLYFDANHLAQNTKGDVYREADVLNRNQCKNGCFQLLANCVLLQKDVCYFGTTNVCKQNEKKVSDSILLHFNCTYKIMINYKEYLKNILIMYNLS